MAQSSRRGPPRGRVDSRILLLKSSVASSLRSSGSRDACLNVFLQYLRNISDIGMHLMAKPAAEVW